MWYYRHTTTISLVVAWVQNSSSTGDIRATSKMLAVAWVYPALLLTFSCSAILVERVPALLVANLPALLVAFFLVVEVRTKDAMQVLFHKDE